MPEHCVEAAKTIVLTISIRSVALFLAVVVVVVVVLEGDEI